MTIGGPVGRSKNGDFDLWTRLKNVERSLGFIQFFEVLRRWSSRRMMLWRVQRIYEVFMVRQLMHKTD